jgi:hypothetical protein
MSQSQSQSQSQMQTPVAYMPVVRLQVDQPR